MNDFVPEEIQQIIINEAMTYSTKGFTGDFAFDDALFLLISSYESLHNRYKKRYSRYKAEKIGTPIFNRDLPNFMKVNNKINNSFMSEIVDTKLGYMIGVPIVYAVLKNELDVEKVEKSEIIEEKYKLNTMYNKIINFCARNSLHNINMETVKTCSICGTSSRLLYINGTISERNKTVADIKAMNIDPWETIFIYNNSETDLLVSIRYFKKCTQDINGNIVRKFVVQLYTDKAIYVLKEDMEKKFSRDVYKTEHIFGMVPLFEFVNNRERQGDCDKVLSIIDAYDKAVSDLSSELEQFRLAYIALYGLKSNKDNMDELRQTGLFEMTKDGKVEFITKKLDIESVLKYLDRLENNIIRFAKSVNFKDENFFGNLSGVAIRYKLMQLEEKAMTAQVKFENSDFYMWKLLEPIFKKELPDFNSILVKRRFTRNIPVNMLEEARIQTELEGMVSTRTRMSVASFIENPELEEQSLINEKILNKNNDIDFMDKGQPGIRTYDIEKGGLTDRNTNGTVGEK
jgi:SPP1 family phage portal protein